MKNWNEYVNFSWKVGKKIYKNLSFSQNLLVILLTILFRFIFGIENFELIFSEL